MNPGLGRPVGPEKIRAWDVSAVECQLPAELLLHIGIDADHHEALRSSDDRGSVEDPAIIPAMRTPVRIDDDAYRLVALLRLGESLKRRAPPNGEIVPLARGECHAE